MIEILSWAKKKLNYLQKGSNAGKKAASTIYFFFTIHFLILTVFEVIGKAGLTAKIGRNVSLAFQAGTAKNLSLTDSDES